MANIVDIVIILIILINAVEGISKGFVLSLFNLLSFFLSIYITKLYYPVFAGYIYSNTYVFRGIKNFIDQKVLVVLNSSLSSDTQKSAIELFRVPKVMENVMFKGVNSTEQGSEVILSTANAISEGLTEIVINIISIIVVFFVVKMLLMLVARVLDMFVSLPVLKQFNKLLGFAFGTIKGVFIILLIFTILTPVISIFPDGIIAKQVLDSQLGLYFYSNNLIIYYLSNMGFIP